MGAVQLYTHLPVGCNSRFSLVSTSCQLLGLNTVTGHNTPLLLDAAPVMLLLDAAPVRHPIYLTIAPTALNLVATPRTHSLTPTFFDRVVPRLHALPYDADDEWEAPCSTDQWVRYFFCRLL